MTRRCIVESDEEDEVELPVKTTPLKRLRQGVNALDNRAPAGNSVVSGKTDPSVLEADGQPTTTPPSHRYSTRRSTGKPSALSQSLYKRRRLHASNHHRGGSDGLADALDEEATLEDSSDGSDPTISPRKPAGLSEEVSEQDDGEANESNEEDSDGNLKDFVDDDDATVDPDQQEEVNTYMQSLQTVTLCQSFQYFIEHELFQLCQQPDRIQACHQKAEVAITSQIASLVKELMSPTWVNASTTKRFLARLQQLPGLHIAEAAVYNDCKCHVCNRCSSRFLHQMKLHGKVLGVRSRPYKVHKFLAGGGCAVRVELYHALLHFRRRLDAHLKRWLKLEQQAGCELSIFDALDKAVNDGRHCKHLFFQLYERLVHKAQLLTQREAFGGKKGRYESKKAVDAVEVSALLHELHSDAEASESELDLGEDSHNQEDVSDDEDDEVSGEFNDVSEEPDEEAGEWRE